MLNEQYRSGVADAAPAAAPDAVVQGAQQSLGAALGIASALGDRGQQLADGARAAFTSGMVDAFSAAAALLVLAAVLFAFLIPGEQEQITDGKVKPEQNEPPLEADVARQAEHPPAAAVPR